MSEFPALGFHVIYTLRSKIDEKYLVRHLREMLYATKTKGKINE